MRSLVFIYAILISFEGYGICEDVNSILRSELRKLDNATPLSGAQRSQIRETESVQSFMNKWKDNTLVSDNRFYMTDMKGPAGKGQRKIFFDVENSVLKGLNDSVLEDKGLGDAVNNLFNQKFHENLSKNPALMEKVNSRYSDYKSLRLSLVLDEGENARAVQDSLNKVYEQTKAQFLAELDTAKMKGLWQGQEGQLGKPETWFLAGSGETPIEANMAARAIRRKAQSGLNPKLANYEDNLEELYSQIDEISSLQKSLASHSNFKSKGVVTKVGDDYVLSKDMISILRKSKRSDFSDLASYELAISKKAKDLFGIKLNSSQIADMTKYFENVDSLSPPLFIRSRQMIPLEQAEKGLVSVDFAGIGVDNAQGAMIGLLKSDINPGNVKGSVSHSLDNIWKEVDGVTDEMNQAQRAYNFAVKEIEPGHSGALFSGDDGMFFPRDNWDAAKKAQLVTSLSKKEASKYRVTFVPTKFPDGSVIPTGKRSEFVVKAEKLEKALRANVTGVGKGKISPELTKDMIMAIDYAPSVDGRGTFNLIIKGKKLTDTELKSIHKAISSSIEEGHSLGTIVN